MAKSFRNFLTQYCVSLCETQTTSIRMFASKLADYPRLKEPLLLLALTQGRADYLLSSINDSKTQQDCREWIKDYRRSGLDLCDYLIALDDGNRFKKCYLSWESDCGALERDRDMLSNVSARINMLIAKRGITRAEACRVAGLNKGNFYAFLKGDTIKLSRKTAIAAYDTLENIDLQNSIAL